MNENDLRCYLEQYKEGSLSQDDLCTLLQQERCGFADLGFAHVDLARESRRGFPEVVYCKGKTAEQSVSIIETLFQRSAGNILATKCSEEIFAAVKPKIPAAEYHPLSQTLTIYQKERVAHGSIAVITAGTSDLPFAEEAAITAEIMGNRVLRITDVGVAGIHRLLAHDAEIQNARVLIVLAGMDGALPSVVGGLYDKPLIAVPTSVGYGANFGGLAALLSMLNSCASGITVVNIDNGFGAACAASRINQLPERVNEDKVDTIST